MKRPIFKAIAAAVATAAMVVSLAACANSPNGASPDKDLTLALSATPPTLDPAKLDLGESSSIWGSLYDTLLNIDIKGKVQGNAAESWQYSSDAKTLTLKLRSGMKFSNGEEVTAEDAVKTIERTQKTPGLRQGDTKYITGVKAPDDRTLVITLSQPDPSLLINLASGLGVIAHPSTLDSPRTATDPVGSGPYVLNKDKTKQGTTYVLDLRSGYWNEKAYAFKRVTFRVIADPTATLNALRSREIDGGFVRPAQVAALKGAGFKTKKVAAGTAMLDLADRGGTVLPQLADVKVRKAINMAFDRKTYVEKLLLGYGSPTEQIFNPYAGAGVPALNNYYSYDPGGAKKLLAEAGYPNGFAVTLPSTFFSTEYEPSITQSLANIGITVKWEPIPAPQINSVLATKKFPMAFWIDGLNQPARELHNQMSPSGILNPYGWTDPKLSQMMRQVASTTDNNVANDQYKKINQYIVENAFTCPLFIRDIIWASNSGIEFLPDGVMSSPTMRNYGVMQK
jgi:peptide/nickel transport system substrate-binding protein